MRFTANPCAVLPSEKNPRSREEIHWITQTSGCLPFTPRCSRVMTKRYDPRMHTAEHILNQTMDRVFGCGRCINAHIEKKRSKCDFRFDRPLTEAELRDLESRINGVIKADLPVFEEWTSTEKAQAFFNLNRLPKDTGEPIRIVNVGDYDACPCIGSHVSSTAEIGRFQITTTGFENGVLRIRYRLRDPDSAT